MAVSAYGGHELALKNDGTVWAWGDNNLGQLGDGTTTNRYTPVQVLGLSGVTAIAAGYGHSLALKNDGTVWAWGYNSNGQLGDGTTTNRYTPVQVTGLSGVTAIAVGRSHSLALKNDGTVWAWGYNYRGQLGDGTTTNRYTPVQVLGLSGVTAIAAGEMHSLALKNDGTVWAWGYNGFNQLGDNSYTDSTTPVQVTVSSTTKLSGVIAISAGRNFSLALKNDGKVWGWGDKSYNQLGNVAYGNRAEFTGITDMTAIASGYSDSLALKNDGTLWTWGGGNTLTQVSYINGVTAFAVGSGLKLAVKNDGTVWSWYATNGYDAVQINFLNPPAAPSSLTSGVFGKQVTISFAASNGATSYDLQRSTDQVNWVDDQINIAAGTVTQGGTVTITTTAPEWDRKFYYRVRASASGVQSDWSAAVCATIPPAAPTGMTATVSGKQVTLTFPAISGAVSYDIQRSNDQTNWANDQTGIAAGTVTQGGTVTINTTAPNWDRTFYYRVSVVTSNGQSDWSAAVTTKIPPAAPTGLIVSANYKQVTLTFPAVDGATSYDLQRSTDQTNWASDLSGIAAGAVTQGGIVTITTAAPEWDRTFYYRVRVTTSGGQSDWSVAASVAIVPKPVPELVSLNETGNSIQVKAKACSIATTYILKRSEDGQNYVIVKTIPAASLQVENGQVTITDDSITYGKHYYYKLGLVLTGGEETGDSSPLDIVPIPPTPPAPQVVSIDGSPGTSVKITVKRADNATSYIIERSQNNGGSWTEFEQVKTIPQMDADPYGNICLVDDNGVQRLTTYKYRVRVQVNGITGDPSLEKTVTTEYGQINPPTNVQAVWVDNGIKVTWEDDSNVAGYQIFRRTPSDSKFSSLPIATIQPGVREYIDTKVTIATYIYMIKAFYYNLKSDPSSEVTVTGTGPLPAPLGLTASPGSTRVELSWKPVNGAPGYVVEMSLASTTASTTNWQQVTMELNNVADKVTTAVTGLTPGTGYQFRVKCAGHPMSKYTLPVKATTFPPAPEAVSNLVASVEGNTTTLTWDGVAGASRYKVERYIGQTLSRVTFCTSPPFVDTGLKWDTTYTYKVFSMTNILSEQAAEVEITTSPPLSPGPIVNVADVKHDSVTLTWYEVEGAAEYIISRSVDGKVFEQVGTTAETRYTDDGLAPFTTYTYKVRANNSVATIKKVTTLLAPPASLGEVRAEVTATAITLTWDNVEGATSYYAERYLQSAPETVERRLYVRLGETKLVDTSFKTGTGYIYKVYPYNGQNAGEPGDVEVMSPPAKPVVRYTILTASKSVKLTMTCPTPDVTYTIERSTTSYNEGFTEVQAGNNGDFTDTELAPGTYYYRVTAVNADGVKSLPALLIVRIR